MCHFTLPTFFKKNMFTGEYNHTIDQKGRLIIPNKFRNLLGEVFFVTKGIDGCLSIYEKEKWEELEKKVEALKITEKKARDFKRFIIGSADECTTDKMGRMLIRQSLRDFAKLKTGGEVVFIGVGDYIEVWDKEMFTERNDFEDFDKLAESLEGLDI